MKMVGTSMSKTILSTSWTKTKIQVEYEHSIGRYIITTIKVSWGTCVRASSMNSGCTSIFIIPGNEQGKLV